MVFGYISNLLRERAYRNIRNRYGLSKFPPFHEASKIFAKHISEIYKTERGMGFPH